MMLAVQYGKYSETKETKMKIKILAIAGALAALTTSTTISLAQDSPKPQTLFTNVNIFDGTNDKLMMGKRVLVEGNVIKTIGDETLKANKGATVIDGDGRTLMPGMIDAHTHFSLNMVLHNIAPKGTKEDLAIRSTIVARDSLMDGFTTGRDVGGSVFALKRAIDSGLVVGPRIYPSGRFISQTSGHGDFGEASRPNPGLSGNHEYDAFERLGLSAIVDGVPSVLAAVRQNLRQGATQIKMMGGGGGSSPWDPIDTTQYSEAEWVAAVEAAADWGTYVTSHIFTDRAVKRALKAGVKSFDHGFFITEPVIKQIAAVGAFVGPQMWGMSPELFNNPSVPASKHAGIKVMQESHKDFATNLLKHNVKVFFASDILGDMDNGRQSRRYELWWRTQAFKSNFEVLKQATSVAGELLQLSGPRNPYPGKLGVIEEGALADILLVDGNPLADIFVLGASKEWFKAPMPPKPIQSLRVIMKDGKVYKNTLK
jgi:imidazolonepropionase-like amidohydrolase